MTAGGYVALVPSEAPVPAALAASAGWYEEVSGGRARPVAQVVAVDPPPGGWSAFAAGRTASREPAAALVAALPVPLRREVGDAVLIVVPDEVDVHPHTWRFLAGGVHLGARRWCRHYAVVRAGAPLGTWVHELGHLLYGWPDGPARSGVGADCLMATGALVGAGLVPAPPCAPLRVAAGWVDPVPVTASTVVADLARGVVGEVSLPAGRELYVEVRDGRLLALTRTSPPALAARLADVPPERHVLALLDGH